MVVRVFSKGILPIWKFQMREKLWICKQAVPFSRNYRARTQWTFFELLFWHTLRHYRENLDFPANWHLFLLAVVQKEVQLSGYNCTRTPKAWCSNKHTLYQRGLKGKKLTVWPPAPPTKKCFDSNFFWQAIQRPSHRFRNTQWCWQYSPAPEFCPT